MKLIASVFSIALRVGTLIACGIAPLDLLGDTALAQVRFHVVDQDGTAVPGAKIWGGFTCGSRMNDYVLVDGVTDTNGVYVAEGRCNEFLRVDVRKDGYYHTEDKIFFGQSGKVPSVVDGKWQPYGETRKVVLKKIKNPWSVKVFDEKHHHHAIPAFDQWVGFDLEVGDWISPYGIGKHNDVALRFRTDIRKPKVDFTYVMEACFTNNPFAGAYMMRKDPRSNLGTEYAAETNGIYSATFSFTTECISNQPAKATYLDADSYLVFRTRTRVDGQGRLLGAHYGKICGIWRSTNKLMQLGDGCFNPNENDPNIEGDQALLYAIRNYRE